MAGRQGLRLCPASSSSGTDCDEHDCRLLQLLSRLQQRKLRPRHTHTQTRQRLTFEHRADLPDAKTADAQELAERQFQEEGRDPRADQAHDVRYQKSTCRTSRVRRPSPAPGPTIVQLIACAFVIRFRGSHASPKQPWQRQQTVHGQKQQQRKRDGKKECISRVRSRARTGVLICSPACDRCCCCFSCGLLSVCVCRCRSHKQRQKHLQSVQ